MCSEKQESGLISRCASLRPSTNWRDPLPLLHFACRSPDAVNLGWAILALQSWDLVHGRLDATISASLRLAFYGTDFLLAATSFTLYTVLARFWADLAFAARQGTGGRDYRYIVTASLSGHCCRKPNLHVSRHPLIRSRKLCTAVDKSALPLALLTSFSWHVVLVYAFLIRMLLRRSKRENWFVP